MYYHVDIRNHCSKLESERICIFSHILLDSTQLRPLRQMTFEQAVSYCRTMWNASVWRDNSDE